MSSANAYLLRQEAARIITEDRVPVEVLEKLVEDFGEGEGAIEWDLLVSIDGVFAGRPFDAIDEAIEATGEALRAKEDNPSSVVSLIVVERMPYQRDERGDMLYRQDARA